MNVSKLELLIAGVLVIGAAGLVFGHTRVPQSTPAKASADFLSAAAGADLASMREVSTPGLYGEVQLSVCRPRFKSAQRVYQKTIPGMAQGDWQRLWRKVDVLAGGEYDRLHEDVARLGRRRFEELEAMKRLELTNDRDRFAEFIYRSGVEALPLEDSRRISSTAAFRAKADRHDFVANEGWKRLSDEDRALLGDPLALSEEETPEKLAFYDRVAIPKLNEENRAAIDGISREDVAGLPLFASRHGERLLREALELTGLSASQGPGRCVFPREENGSLFRGAEAKCDSSLFSARGSGDVAIVVQKAGFKWRVAGVSDRFFNMIGRS